MCKSKPPFLRLRRHSTRPHRELARQNRLSSEHASLRPGMSSRRYSMLHVIQPRPLVALALLTIVVMASAQTQRQRETFSIQGYMGQGNVIRSQGRVLVDVQDLARITKGALRIEENRIILTLAPSDASEPDRDTAGTSGFSIGFERAAIEAMASIRE